MKKCLAALLLSLLLLSACAPLPPEPAEIETEPTQATLSPTSEAPGSEDGLIWSADSGEEQPIMFSQFQMENKLTSDERGACLVYTGEEMKLDLKITAYGLEEKGLALYIYLDGQIQPFRLEEGGELAYTHTVYPPGNSGITETSVYFTPARGQTGDHLDMELHCWAHPGYSRGMEPDTKWHKILDFEELELPRIVATSLKFEATPPALELPVVEDRLGAWSVACETPAVATETYKQGYPLAGFTVNGVQSIDPPVVYNVKSGDTLQLRYKLFSLPAGQYSLVFLLDGQPVSTDPADWIHFEAENGQEAVVEAELSLNEFEDVGKITVVYMRREGTDRVDSAHPVFYLSSAQYYEAHVELVNGAE